MIKTLELQTYAQNKLLRPLTRGLTQSMRCYLEKIHWRLKSWRHGVPSDRRQKLHIKIRVSKESTASEFQTVAST